MITHELCDTVKRCTGIAEVMGSNPVGPELFSGLIFTATEVEFISASIISILHTHTVNAKRCSSSCNYLGCPVERETTQLVVMLVESVSLL